MIRGTSLCTKGYGLSFIYLSFPNENTNQSVMCRWRHPKSTPTKFRSRFWSKLVTVKVECYNFDLSFNKINDL